jgi:UrcA family protein
MKTAIKIQSKLAKSVVAASFLALGCAVIGGQALAQQPSAAEASQDVNDLSVTNWSVTYPVRFSDLDVSTMKGAKTLYLRIRYAAEVVCKSTATWGKKAGEACVRKAMINAVERINRPLLSQYYQLRIEHNKAGLAQLAKAN